ncbi:hypothetical protein [Hymenobacter sediminicola]|uniref:Uncharacterized protein n=1 Tax=Hymenobacter sediminicola TaxID=2761579 RepID=A0A7G7W7S6_9BACT|nr:hypothetical protein [Hymenobacter sediminicola]QNH62419.1 hypothetical protein H4317_00895 [Hymenobacter sediminicola]
MTRIILLLMCVLMALLEPETAHATPNTETTALAGATESEAIPRPNYKRYKGNSRTKKHKMGFFRKRAARRKAMRKRRQKVTAPKGVIRVDKPTGTMPKPAN